MPYFVRRLGISIVLAMFTTTSFGSNATNPSIADTSSAGVGRWYLGLQGGLLFPDRARNRENAGAVGIRFGRVLNPNWNLELNFLDSRHSGNFGNPQLTLRQASFDALRVFDRTSRFAPFFKVGLGLLEDKPRGQDSRTNLMEEAGVGMIVQVWRSADESYAFDLRPEADLRWDGCHGCGQTMMDGMVGLGFELAFGGAKEESKPVAAHVTDKTVSPPTRPVPAPVVIPPVPPPPPVLARAAPPQPKPIVLTQVHFAVNSADLRPGSRVFLDRMAAGLKANPKIRIALEGYTDSTGKIAYNLGLSQRRADAVRTYLIDHGVPNTQLSAKGFGAADPVASNKTPAGRQANRRTVMRVTANPDAIPVEHVLCGSSC